MEDEKTEITTGMDNPKTWTCSRDGDRPLRFRGELIGEGESGSGGSSGYSCDWNRGVKVKIIRRVAGGYVLTRRYWSQWQGEGGGSEAMICGTPAALLSQLSHGPEGDYLGQIGRAELEALHDAAGVDGGIASVAVEDLDA